MPNLRPIELALIGFVLLFMVFFVFVVTMIVISAARSRGVITEDEYQSARSSALHQG